MPPKRVIVNERANSHTLYLHLLPPGGRAKLTSWESEQFRREGAEKFGSHTVTLGAIGKENRRLLLAVSSVCIELQLVGPETLLNAPNRTEYRQEDSYHLLICWFDY